MLTAFTGILSFNLILFVLANFFYQNRYVRIVRNAGFLIALLTGTAIGVVAYLTKSPTYSSEFSIHWFTYIDVPFHQSLTINSAIAYSIGFYSLLHLIILFLSHEVLKNRERYNYLFGAYIVVIGLLLSNDLMTFMFFWCWSVILLMLLIRQELPSFNYPPVLGIFVLLVLCLLIINLSRRTFLPNETIISQCPAESMLVLGSLVTILVLIQGCQFPFPVWLPVGTSTKQDLTTIFIYFCNAMMSVGALLWKFNQVLLPVHRVILGIGGFLTILLAFIRIHMREFNFKTSLIYYSTGMLGLVLITLLSDNPPFLVQLLAGFQVTMSILILGQPWVKPVDLKEKNRFFIAAVDFLTLALIAGVPLSIHHVIRLTLLKDLFATQQSPVFKYFGIIILALGTFAVIGMTTRIITQIRHNRSEGELNPDTATFKGRHVIALMLLLVLGFGYFYPIEPASGMAPISQSVLLKYYHQQAVSLESVVLVNQVLTGFWAISLAGFFFLGTKVTFSPSVRWSRMELYKICLGQTPNRLANLILSIGSIRRRWQTQSGRIISPMVSHLRTAIKVKVTVWISFFRDPDKRLGHLRGHRLWLLGLGIALLVAGIVLLIFYLVP